MPIEQLKREVQRVAAEIREAMETNIVSPGAGQHQGSAHRRLPEPVRQHFISVRGELFERGVFDPVLVRFDSATAPQAETAAIADHLEAVASSL